MSDYISRDELFDNIRNDVAPFNVAMVFRHIHNIPAADVAPVRHGYWEFPIFTDSDDGLDPRVKCSECGSVEAAFARWKYCPNCGAKMDKEDEHETD